MKKRKFPGSLFVKIEFDKNDPSAHWFLADETAKAESYENGERVAEYKFVRFRRVKKTAVFVDSK